MPMIAPIIGLIGAAISGTEMGLNLAGVGKPSPGDAKKQQEAAALKQLQADQQAKQRAIGAALPDAQEQGGGALAGPSLLSLGTSIAGLPGEAGTGAGKGALSQFLGGNAPTQDNMVNATYGLSGSMG